MSMSSEIVNPLILPRNCNVPDRSVVPQSVRRRLFGCEGGENVTQLLDEENNRNKKRLRDKFNIVEQDLWDSTTSTMMQGQNKIAKKTCIPNKIEVELLNYHKSLDEKKTHIKHGKKITPSDDGDKGKCKVSTSKNQEDVRQSTKQKSISDCFTICKKIPPSKIKRETLLELRTPQSNTESSDKACKALELTSKGTQQFLQSKTNETPDGLTNARDMKDTVNTTSTVAASAGAAESTKLA